MAAYTSWGEREGLDPAVLESDVVLAIWLTAEHPNWAWKTASHAVSAIGGAFEDLGRSNPSDGEHIRRVLTYYRRTRPRTVPPTSPLTPTQLVQTPLDLRRGDAHATALAAAVTLAAMAGFDLAVLARLREEDVQATRDAIRIADVVMTAGEGPLHATAVRSVSALVALHGPTQHPLLWPFQDATRVTSPQRAAIRLERLATRSAERIGLTDSLSYPLGLGSVITEDLARLWICGGPAGGVRRTRNRAMVLCGLGHRAADLARLDLRDVVLNPDHHTAFLPRSKSDPAGHGRTLVWDHTSSSNCPHCALEDWVITLRHMAPQGAGALFPPLMGESISTSRLTAMHVTTAVRAHCRKVGLDPAVFSSRSLRVGGATALAAAGADLEEITSVTGHRTAESAAMYLRFESVEPARLGV